MRKYKNRLNDKGTTISYSCVNFKFIKGKLIFQK